MKRYVTVLLTLLLVLPLFSCIDTLSRPGGSPPEDNKIYSPIYNGSSRPDYGRAPVKGPADPVKTELSFVGVGDNIIYWGNVRDAMSKKTEGGRKHNFLPSYSSVRDIIKKADIAFINQETLMTGGELSYYPRFNSPRDLAYDLIDVGFDIVNISNNHMLDKGPDGLTSTIDFWNSLDVTMIGGYKDKNDFDNIRIHENNGVRIALLSFTEHTNGLCLESGTDLCIPYLTDENLKNQVALAKEISDLIFVSVHWGDENSFSPSHIQKHYAKLMTELGVDVILGHHPHVIQPIEWLEGQNGHRTLCVYSLGNFMAEMEKDYNMVGGIISFDIVKLDDNKPTIEDPIFIPTMFHFPRSFYDNHIYLLEHYTPELASVHGVKTFYGNSLSYDQLFDYVKNTIPAEFLPVHYKN